MNPRAAKNCTLHCTGDRTNRAGGYSLLEVMVASSICVVALVPALAILRDGISATEAIDKRHMVLLYAVEKMEEELAVVAATWTNASASGDFASEGHPDIRYSVARSDSAANGGIPNQLMNVSVTAYDDADGDDALDAGEPRTVLTTKVSKLATYESLAGS
jgi:Tfp pilus assembly protein PilV